MTLDDAVVLITGANRGIGLALARAALERGARTVYAAARDPASVALAGAVPVRLDVTNAAEVAAAAERCGDATVVVNNAGIAQPGAFLADGAFAAAERHLETNFYGVWRVAAAFAPVLARNGGGTLVNVLSVASWINSPRLATYGASKSAAWALTNGLRHELRAQGTRVVGVHVGFVDTDLTRGFDVPKISADVAADRIVDGIDAGLEEVLVDDRSRAIKQGLSSDPAVYLKAPGS